MEGRKATRKATLLRDGISRQRREKNKTKKIVSGRGGPVPPSVSGPDSGVGTSGCKKWVVPTGRAAAGIMVAAAVEAAAAARLSAAIT